MLVKYKKKHYSGSQNMCYAEKGQAETSKANHITQKQRRRHLSLKPSDYIR